MELTRTEKHQNFRILIREHADALVEKATARALRLHQLADSDDLSPEVAALSFDVIEALGDCRSKFDQDVMPHLIDLGIYAQGRFRPILGPAVKTGLTKLIPWAMATVAKL